MLTLSEHLFTQENRYLKAAKSVNEDDEAAAVVDRVARLLPRIKQLLAPTQDELTAYLEVVRVFAVIHRHAAQNLNVS